ncbi:MAG: hypothetical protein WCA44_11060 [Acidobacteriaceae bacterium]
MFSGEGGFKKNPAVEAAGFFAGSLHAKKKATSELVLPWHEPLRLSKAVCKRRWRFTEKLFSGSGFATTRIAGRCSGSASAAIAGSGTAAQSVGDRGGAGNIAQLTGVISRASKGVWIIVTASAPIVAGESQAG